MKIAKTFYSLLKLTNVLCISIGCIYWTFEETKCDLNSIMYAQHALKHNIALSRECSIHAGLSYPTRMF